MQQRDRLTLAWAVNGLALRMIEEPMFARPLERKFPGSLTPHGADSEKEPMRSHKGMDVYLLVDGCTD